MLKTFAAFLVAAVLGTGFATSGALAAGTCSFGDETLFPGNNLVPDGDVSQTIACSGIYDAGITVVSSTVASIVGGGTPSAEQAANEFSVNALAFRGITNWQLAEEVSGAAIAEVSTSNDNGMNLTISKTNGDPLTSWYPKLGRWSVSSFGADAVRAAIVILNERNDWSIYLIKDLSVTSGAWSFNNYVQEAAKDRELKSFQLYITTAVPVPAALPLLLTGLGGMAFLSRRKRKAA